MQYPRTFSCFHPVRSHKIIHDIDHVTIDIIVQGQIAVGIRGHAPIHQISVESLFDEFGNHAATLFQVKNVGPVDERINENQRRAMNAALSSLT